MSLTLGVILHIHLLNVVVWFIAFLNSATLIFRGMGISKCLRESFGIRDKESRLYLVLYVAFESFLFVLHLSFFWCLGRAALRDCGIPPVYPHLYFCICFSDRIFKLNCLN